MTKYFKNLKSQIVAICIITALTAPTQAKSDDNFNDVIAGSLVGLAVGLALNDHVSDNGHIRHRVTHHHHRRAHRRYHHRHNHYSHTHHHNHHHTHRWNSHDHHHHRPRRFRRGLVERNGRFRQHQAHVKDDWQKPKVTRRIIIEETQAPQSDFYVDQRYGRRVHINQNR